ncbi:TPA: NAD-dependent epimerase/dehydratase family protein [Streptococcus suis]|uniref:Nucleoside-diphosphate-sugar epimerase n=1 Tax=Streptococcus suis TaxID=1307 RepID=M1VJY6_STRSU|nr:nucleoside-diphosphate-sugar epimerase [Streptococcus suis]HEM3177747.1 NAD-dependent epimerase/dehydratase family protein [Streptococcus suis]
MNILILGAAGFIGTNLTLELMKSKNNNLTLVDKNRDYFQLPKLSEIDNVSIIESSLDNNINFDEIVKNQDVVYHLVSSVVPSTSNQHISQDIEANVLFTSNFLEACVRNSVKKVIFISSGGTVYGKVGKCPLVEETNTAPISSYGVQKVMIEKLLYLYNYMYGLEYKIVRLANPYGPYQRPNGVLGAVTTFTYKAIKGDEITIYGDGSVIRDYIYIDDAIKGIITIANEYSEHNVFNLGSGYGTSIMEILDIIRDELKLNLNLSFKEGRSVDVPINFLDMSRYIESFGEKPHRDLREGIVATAKFLSENY